jgi:hypothetical protein
VIRPGRSRPQQWTGDQPRSFLWLSQKRIGGTISIH